jgi:hypothetical protein
MRWMGDTLGQGPPGKPLHSGPPPPPPTVKGRTVGGGPEFNLNRRSMRQPLSRSDVCLLYTRFRTPPPPPPAVKGRTVGGVRKSLWTVDLSASL